MSEFLICKECGARVKKEENIAHLVAEHRELQNRYGYKGGTLSILESMYKPEETVRSGPQ